jgi:hypothetical protein
MASPLMEYVLIVAVIPPAISAVMLLFVPRARGRMPGGATRLFRAFWLQSVGVVLGVVLAKLLGTTVEAPSSSTEHDVLLAICVFAASVGSAFVFRRLPWTATLVRDFSVAVRPHSQTNSGKA